MQAPESVFLKRAAECERMAELTRDPESKFVWRRMADRWHRCAKVVASAASKSGTQRRGAEKGPENSARAADLDRLSRLTGVGQSSEALPLLADRRSP